MAKKATAQAPVEETVIAQEEQVTVDTQEEAPVQDIAPDESTQEQSEPVIENDDPVKDTQVPEKEEEPIIELINKNFAILAEQVAPQPPSCYHNPSLWQQDSNGHWMPK